MRSAKRRKVNVLEMKCLRSLVGVHEWIKLGMKRSVEELASRADQREFRGFGHVERMDEF